MNRISLSKRFLSYLDRTKFFIVGSLLVVSLLFNLASYLKNNALSRAQVITIGSDVFNGLYAFGQYREPHITDQLDNINLWRQVSVAYLSANESIRRLSQLDSEYTSFSFDLHRKMNQLEKVMSEEYSPLLRFFSNSVTEVTEEDKALLLRLSKKIVAAGFTTSVMGSWDDLERCLDKFLAE